MNEHELLSVLEDLGLEKIRRRNGRKGLNYTFCCPYHHENNPSAGILLDGDSAYGFCFSCKQRFTLPQLIAHCEGTTVYDALLYVNEKFNVDYRDLSHIKTFKEYGEIEVEKRFELPTTKLAPFRSGKQTHKYFFDRGFNSESVRNFLIGWDRIKKRITIPVFYQDGVLSGIIGRAIYEMDTDEYEDLYGNEPKYFIYDNFPIGDNLIGLPQFKEKDKTAILVEGSFDVIWMHQLGFTNTLSTIIANFTERQRDILFKLGIENVILFYDNDPAGRKAAKLANEILKSHFKVFKVNYPAKDIKDVMQLNKKQLDHMLKYKEFYGKVVFNRVN